VKLSVWSPWPPAASGVADYAAEQLAALREHARVTAVAEAPEAVRGLPDGVAVAAADAPPAADLDLYHLGNSALHGFVYRRARAVPGVVLIHDACLHHLVLGETVERGDAASYLRLMRREHGERGTFVARQIARGLGGALWPALHPLSEHLLEESLGVVALSRATAAALHARLGRTPVLALPMHLPPCAAPSQAEARRALGLPADALLVTSPGLANPHKRLAAAAQAVARLRSRFPSLQLVVAGDVEPGFDLGTVARAAGLGSDGLRVTGRLSLSDFAAHLAAADVVLALRFPSHGEMSAALVRAMGLGRACLVSAETPAALEFPEGVVAPVDPGPLEGAHLEAVLTELCSDRGLRDAMGAAAADHVRRHHDPAATARTLSGFLAARAGAAPGERDRIASARRLEGTRLGSYVDEVRWAARELGLGAVPPAVVERLREVAG
jgi:glycosyltransferase involved in cell wall biosynthesis